MAKKQVPQANFQVTKSGDAFEVSIPIIDIVLERVITDLGITKGFAIYKKAILAAGRVGLRYLRAELKKHYGRLNKSQKRFQSFEYGETGALTAAQRVYFRTAKSGLYSYAVIGTDADLQVPARRGKQTIYAKPSSYIHLVNQGFIAVGRVAGQRGRKTNQDVVWALRTIARHQKIENASKLGMRRLLEEKTDRLFFQQTGAKRFALRSAYIARYQSAKKTTVEGRFYLQKAARSSRDDSVAAAMTTMQTEFEKALKEMEQRNPVP